MEMHQIRYFLAVYRNQSFTRAADECNVSQPSLSSQIMKLEEELGGPLFHRSRQGARLTQRGEVFRPRAQEILQQTEHALIDAQDLDGLSRGQVHLGCLPTTGAFLLPDLLGDFGTRYPNIHVNLLEESSPGLATALLNFDIELAILDEAGMVPGLSGDVLFTEPLYLAVPPDHPLAGQGMVDLTILADQPMILMKPGHGFHTIVHNALTRAGVDPQVVYESAEIETVQGLVGAGLGLSLVPKMVRKAWGISYVEIAPPSPSRTLLLGYREGAALGPAAAALRQVALERLRK